MANRFSRYGKLEKPWSVPGFRDWSRYSARQRRSMPFGGLVGSVRYEGEGLQAIIPWLRLAEWLHAGNKSTFGLGVCRLI